MLKLSVRPLRLFVLCVSCLIFVIGSTFSSTAEAQIKPNIIFINLDDADRDLFDEDVLEKRFPNLAALAKGGMIFSNFHVTSPLCGPSRACLLRGQYAHSIGHRVNVSNGPNSLGLESDFDSFIDRGYYDDDMGRWMKDAGYHTSFVGKYLNGGTIEKINRIPAGWNDFRRYNGSPYFDTWRFTNEVHANGIFEKLPSGVYRTDAEADDLVDIIHNHEHIESPLFLYYAPFGPHSESAAPGGMIPARYQNYWPNLNHPFRPDFDEANMSDKSSVYAELPRLSEPLIEEINEHYRERVLSMKAVDDAIGRIVKALRDTGSIDNTYLFITSDNGYSLGQHRIIGKSVAFSRSAHVPLIVNGPGLLPGQSANHLLAHIDLAPTFLDMADADSKPFFDGRSFKRLLFGAAAVPPSSWRHSILIENWQTKIMRGVSVPVSYIQLRNYASTYTEFANGDREYYDLNEDPFELRNAYSDLSHPEISGFQNRMRFLRSELPEPLNSISRPLTNNEVVFGPPFQLEGIAEDSQGVASVRLVILNSAKEFWNGTGWQTERATVDATLANQDGLLTNWSYDFAPPEPEDVLTERYQVIPKTHTHDRRFTKNPPSRSFSYDTLPPNTEISKIIEKPFARVRVNGRSTDNVKSGVVRVFVQNLVTKEYLDGENWTTEKKFMVVDVDDKQRWTLLTPSLPSARYVVRARAYDAVGNFDETPDTEHFEIE